VTRTLEAKLLLKGEDKTGKATRGAARGLQDVSRQAKRAEDAWKRASAAQRAMAANVRTNAREVERLHSSMAVQSRQHEQQIRRINGAVGRVRSSGAGGNGVMLGMSGRFLTVAGAVVTATKAFKDYASAQDQLDRVGLTGGADEKTMDAADDRMRKIAQTVAMSISDVRGGLSTLVSTGMSVEDSMAILEAVAKTAQASGAGIDDVAASAVAAGDSFKIAAGDMQTAFDVMAFAGELGMFELPDMARYLPQLLPVAATRGYEGVEGLKRLMAMLQVVRAQSGTAENAYNGLRDLLSKMESGDTANKFEDFGIDIRKWMAQARAEGRDEITAFLDAINKAIGTDYSKLIQLLGDMQSRSAALTLLNNRDQVEEYVQAMDGAAGTVDKNLDRLTDNLTQRFQRVKNAGTEVFEAIGEAMESFGLPEGMLKTTETLETIAQQIRDISKDAPGYIDAVTGAVDGALGEVLNRKGGLVDKTLEDLPKYLYPVGPDGLVEKSGLGKLNEWTGGAFEWIVDDSERVTPAAGDGSPGAHYEHPVQQAAAEAGKWLIDRELGEKWVPVPAPAPGRASTAAPFQMGPDDLNRPIIVSDFALPPSRDAPAAAAPWGAYTLPRGRPEPDAVAPFQMGPGDIAAPVVAAAGALPQAVQGLVDEVEGAADAVDRFRALLDGGAPRPAGARLGEMDDDALLAMLGGEAPAPARTPTDATLGSGGVFRTEAEIDGIGEAADAAADKLAALPSAMPVGELGAAGRQGAEAFSAAFGQALATGVRAAFAGAEAEARAGAARLGAAASVSVGPRVVRRPGVDADRGASMPDISDRTP